MPKRHIQPPELFDSSRFGYSQVVAVDDETSVYISGQTAMDAKFNVVGKGDVGAQAEAAFSNLRHALAAVGGTPADITSLRIYVVDYGPASMAAVGPVVQRFFENTEPPAQTLLGVQALGMPELLIGIEATAAVAR